MKLSDLDKVGREIVTHLCESLSELPSVYTAWTVSIESLEDVPPLFDVTEGRNLFGLIGENVYYTL